MIWAWWGGGGGGNCTILGGGSNPRSANAAVTTSAVNPDHNPLKAANATVPNTSGTAMPVFKPKSSNNGRAIFLRTPPRLEFLPVTVIIKFLLKFNY